MSDRIFYPISSRDFVPYLKPTQRYRNAFGDARLRRRIDELKSLITTHQSVVINQLSESVSLTSCFYRLLNNPYVELSELIDYNCQIEPELVADQSLLCLLDSSSTSLVSWLKEKGKTSPRPGVVEDNRTPGFYLHSCLVVEEHARQVIGLGDMVLYDRPKNNLSSEEKQRARDRRSQLPVEQRESYVWPLAAANTHKKLQKAKQVTYVLDQGGDNYEALAELRHQTNGAHILVRSKENRLGINPQTDEKAKMTQLLEKQDWQDERQIAIRGLNHKSKSSGKWVIRQARKAKMKIRFIPIELCLPSHLKSVKIRLDGVFSLIEVMEDPSTVPPTEDPIHWRLLTSLPVNDLAQAWHIVACYQVRWLIEQLFRIYKKQGLDIEHSQFQQPDAVKRQAILAIKAASQVLQLTMARQDPTFTPLERTFQQPQEKIVLQKLQDKLSGKTEKITNPHPINSLAWAAWLIARLGGWKGYQNKRPPGPITMHRGLKRFNSIIWANNLMNDP